MVLTILRLVNQRLEFRLSKIIVFGSGGFIGNAICKLLTTANERVVRIDRKAFSEIKSTPIHFQKTLEQTDIIIFCAAIVPAKTSKDFTDNMILVNDFINLTNGHRFAYLLNISSDAVYGDYKRPISESDSPQPTSTHGMMHYSREFILHESFAHVMGNLRPTLIFGPRDPHNSYGPNRFIRQALAKNPIEIIGLGEEQRDHIFIDDVAKIAQRMIELRLRGTVNAATGQTTDYKTIALYIQSQIPKAHITFMDRQQQNIPHNGYRAFDTSKLQQIAPDLKVLDVEQGIKTTLIEGM